MGSIADDLRYALRTLLKRPAFTLVAVGSLALGIGINSTIFAWVNRILLAPLPGVANSREMVSIKTVAPNGDLLDSSYLDYLDFRNQAKTLAGAIAFKERPVYLGTEPEVQRVWSQMVSGDFFDVLGVHAVLGRTFSRQEQAAGPGAAPVAVISDSLWRRQFQADSNVIGRVVKLNQQPFTIIGVTPPGFAGTVNGLNFDLWVPLSMLSQLTGSWNWLEDRNSRPLALMARLAPQAGLREAQVEMSGIAKRLESAYPDSNRNLGARVLTIADSPDGVQSVLGSLLKVLIAIGAAVLLIVCANVGNLLLARATSRQKEFGIRLSLGATRGRLLQQLFTEAFLLAVSGGALGLLAASWLTRGIDLLLPPTDLPLANMAGSLDSAGLVFTILLAFITTLLCGLAPAWQTLRRKANEILRDGARGLTAGSRTRSLRGILVVSELALALIALIGSGLLIRSFVNARVANPGFNPSQILLAGLDLSQSRYPAEKSVTLLRNIREHLLTVPGVRNVSMCEDVPLGFSGGSWEEIAVQGYSPRRGENMKLYRNVISPGYFATLQIPLLEGRDFNDLDDRRTSLVAIVNQTFVQRFLAGRPAIGHKFRGWGKDITIIGVARDSKYHRLSESAQPYFYVPISQFFSSGMGMGIEVKTMDRPEAFSERLRAELRSVDPNVAISGTAPFVNYMSASYFAQKVGASLLSVLGSIALSLAMLGLYGMMTYSISQRTHEIGIRMAVGARPAQVLQLVIREGMRLCVVGAGVGLILALLLSRLAASILFGVQSYDPAICIGATAVLVSFALIATWLPARRASKVDPIEALRWE